MNYAQAAEWLDALTDPERRGFGRNFARKMNLETSLALLAGLGEPHLKLPALHVAGTKGKGSVAAMVEAAARAAGHRTMLFTSPHLVSWRERVRFDGRLIAEEQFNEDAATKYRVETKLKNPQVRIVEDPNG